LLLKPNDAYKRLLYNRNKAANISRIIREFELKKFKNKTVQPDTVRYQVWRDYGRKRDLYSWSIYSYTAEIMTEEEENTHSSRRLLFEEKQYISRCWY